MPRQPRSLGRSCHSSGCCQARTTRLEIWCTMRTQQMTDDKRRGGIIYSRPQALLMTNGSYDSYT